MDLKKLQGAHGPHGPQGPNKPQEGQKKPHIDPKNIDIGSLLNGKKKA